jgi:predicted aspartyl protease
VTTRRALMLRAGALALAGGGLFAVRDRLPWPPLIPRFVDDRATPWTPLAGRGDLIELNARIGDVPVRALIDSGAQISAIDQGLAERLGLPRTLAAPVLAYGLSGAPTLTGTVRLDLTLPGLAVPRLRAAALDLARLAALTDRPLDLILGRDLLSVLALEADFARGAARLIARDAFRPDARARAIPLTRRGGAPTLPAQIEGRKLDLLVDTGSSGGIALSEPAARRAGLLDPGRTQGTTGSVGIGGLVIDRTVMANAVEVAGETFAALSIQVYRHARAAPAPDGIIGLGWLRAWRIDLDLTGRRLGLAPPGVSMTPSRVETTPPAR